MRTQIVAAEEPQVPSELRSRWIAIGAIICGLSVACGAFAAHGLEGYFRTKYAGMEYEKKVTTASGPEVVERIPLAKKYLGDFDTGARYQMYHGLALMALGLLPMGRSRRLVNLAGCLFLLGIAGFSGGLYIYTVWNQRWVGMTVVPLGGTFFLAGWTIFARAAWKRDRG